jgi:hypothetical protein
MTTAQLIQIYTRDTQTYAQRMSRPLVTTDFAKYDMNTKVSILRMVSKCVQFYYFPEQNS